MPSCNNDQLASVPAPMLLQEHIAAAVEHVLPLLVLRNTLAEALQHSMPAQHG